MTGLAQTRRAGCLSPGSSAPGSFYLPPDPRSDDVRRADAAPGAVEERFFGGSRQRRKKNS